jgi:dihydroorotate dehydrogenase (fumarate)
MNILVSAATGAIYRIAVKPVLFRQKPDDVHNRMIKGASYLQRSRLADGLLSANWSYRNPMLTQTLHGITFENPVGLSAGFDKNFQLLPMLKAIGFGFMEGGSLTFRACDGNPRPWFYRLPKTKSLVVHAGLANEGVEAITVRLQAYPANTFEHFPLNISVAKTNSPEACDEKNAIQDYIGSLKKIKKSGVGNMITLNISCPNTFGGEPFTTPARLEHLLAEVDKLRLDQPIFVKMPVNLEWREFSQLLRVIVKHAVTGVTISNLTKDRRRAHLKDILPDDVQGGLSGKPTFELSNELIAKTYRHYGDRLTIIGVGGIFSAEDAYTKIKLGASLVELITGMIFEGPQLIGQINRGLVKLLHQDGFTSISEAIGSGNRAPR